METVKNLSLPCRVYVELTDGECYTGALFAFNQKFKSVELTELSDMESKQKLKGVQTFFESEIEKIEPLDATPSGSSKSSESLTEPEQKKSRHDDRKSLQPRQSESRKCELKLDRVDSGLGPITTTIDDAEMKHIDERIRSAVLIVQCDVSYHQALEDLRRQEIVGLNIEGSRLGRLRFGSLLAFSTMDKIYLFDLKSFGRIFSDMKKILESNKPRKIVHNSCLIVDHLKRQYKCQLNGIQDTLVSSFLSNSTRHDAIIRPMVVDLQVTHILIKKQKEVITIGDCLSEYFNIRIQPKHEV